MNESQNLGTHPWALLSKNHRRTRYGETQYLYSLPETLELRDTPENRDRKGSLQETHKRSHTPSRKCWWLDNSRSQSSQWKLWISKQSPIRCRGTRFGNSMDSIISVQNQNFTRNRKEFAKVLGADAETKSHLNWQFLRKWQSLWSLILESLYVDTSPFRNKWDCWKSGTQDEVQYCCNQAWKKWWAGSMEGHCYLWNIPDLLSCGRTPNQRRFGEPFKGPIIPFGSLVEYHTVSAKDLSRHHQFGKKVLPGIFLGYVLYAGWIWKRDIMVADIKELEKMDASEIHARRLNAKEVITPKTGHNDNDASGWSLHKC